MNESNEVKLIREAARTGDVQHLMDLGYEMLGNPLLLVDISLSFVAHAGGNTVSDEPLWEWTLSKGYVTDEYAESVMSVKAPREDPNSRFIWEKGLLSHDQLVGVVFQNEVPLGYLKLLAYNHEITEEDISILDTLCNLIGMLLSNKNATLIESDNPIIESFITSLLTGKLYEPAAIAERAAKFGLKLYDNLVIIAVKLCDEVKSIKERTLYLKKQIANSLARKAVVIYGGYIVALYDSKNEKVISEHEMSSLKKLLSRTGCPCGISPVFGNLTEVSENYKKAVSAIKIGVTKAPDERIYIFDDYTVDDLLISYAKISDLENLIHPEIRKLIKATGNKSDIYLETLFTFIDNFMNITETSKELHVHHNTLKYRIDRIKEITDLDFDDSDTIFRIALAKRVLERLK